MNLDPTVRAEIQKTHPALIVCDDAIRILLARVIVPLTDWKDRYEIARWIVRISPDTTNGLSKATAADAFQIRSVSQARVVYRIGSISNVHLQELLKAFQTVTSV